jgi:teichuronic acid biosynthesis glycosyltransferase TuaC
MKVLIVCSGNSGSISPFVREQVESVKTLGVEFTYYTIIGKGISGYLSNVKPLKSLVKSFRPDLIHAHYGLSGLLSFISKGNTRLVTTFHGNDINPLYPQSKIKINWNKLLSIVVHLFSDHTIFVSDTIARQIPKKRKKYDIIPCQVNLDIFYPMDMVLARTELNLDKSKKYILFSSSFNTFIKNYPLAKKSCSAAGDADLIELKGYTRDEVNLLLNACNLALITSFNEGSSQFLKEAMASNRPVVSTNVGDAEVILKNIEGCYLSKFDYLDISDKINQALNFSLTTGQTKGREKIINLGLDDSTIPRRVFEAYSKVMKKT